MKRLPPLFVVVLAAGCGGSHMHVDSSVRVSAAPPPSPSTRPDYPTFSAHSCWARNVSGGVMRAAPSAPAPSIAHPPSPARLAQLLLQRFGDGRYVRRVVFAGPPPITLSHVKGYYGGVRPPFDAQWAYISVPLASLQPAKPTPTQVGEQMVASWEANLVAGGLRDDLCTAGGAPLVGWTTGRDGMRVADQSYALEQRFPNPTAQAFRRRVQLIAKRYGFRVASLRLLRPRQFAPLLVVQTDRSRKDFVADVPAILALLDPTTSGHGATALTFEGFFFEARDAKGPFVRTENVYRGEVEGGEWSWNRCVYPFQHSEPLGAKPCP
jgi:hypothetical protein